MPNTNGQGAKGGAKEDNGERVALYLRVSSEEQREKETIKAQGAFLENYVELYSLDVAGVYSDDGVSGTIPLHERPAGRQLLADAKAGEFGTVLVYRLDRIGRTLLSVIDAHDRLAGAGVALKSATEPMDTASPAGRLIFQMLASFGEYERASIVERSRDGLQRAFKDGKQLGCIPYGYDIADDGSFIIVEDEAAIVRRIIAEVAGGATLYAVIKSLNDEGVPSPGRKYRGRPREYGPSWAHSTVRGIIRQGAYSGTHTVKAHDGPVERSVPAIVEPELQTKAQARLAENKRYSGGRPRRKYLLRGLIFCETCGTAYVGDPACSSTGHRYNYYGCGKNKIGYDGRHRPGCPHVGAEWLEGLVWADVRRFLEEPGEALERARESFESESEGESLEERRADLTRRLEGTQGEKNRLIKAYSQGLIDDEELEVQLVDLRNRIENLKMLIAAVDADLARESEAQQVAASTEAWLMTLRENLEEIEQDTEEAWAKRREIVSLLVDKITVGRDEEGRTKVSVTYRFGPTESGDFVDGERDSSEFDLANGFRVVADGYAEEPDIYHTCQTLAEQCEEHVEKLKPFVDHYGEEKPEEPDRLYHELFDEVRQGSLGLLRDLQDLYLMAHFCDITWTMIGQAAQGARDRELLEVVETYEGQTATQIKWLKTRMKQAAPQVLLVAS